MRFLHVGYYGRLRMGALSFMFQNPRAGDNIDFIDLLHLIHHKTFQDRVGHEAF